MPVEKVGNGLGFEQLGVASALTVARSLGSIPADVRCIALCQCALTVDGNGKGNVAVRWRNDGVAPTADTGQELAPGESISLDTGLYSLQFIGVGANAKVNVTYLPW